ncbi:MAG: hypothetical protein KGN02_08190 [bacterium]|nr:hypothetical protein [bacterium]
MMTLAKANARFSAKVNEINSITKSALDLAVTNAQALLGRLHPADTSWLTKWALGKELSFIEETERLAHENLERARTQLSEWNALSPKEQSLRVDEQAATALRIESPEVMQTLDEYHRGRKALLAAAKSISTKFSEPHEAFLSGHLEASLFPDVFTDDDGAEYRRLYVEPPAGLGQYFVTPNSATFPDGSGTGVARLNETNGFGSIWRDDSFQFVYGENAYEPASKAESALNARFSEVIRQRAQRLDQWQENLISADIIDVFEKHSSFVISVNGMIYHVVLTVFKQQHKAESLHGDLCVVVESRSDEQNVIGAAYMEAKKVDLVSKRFRAIKKAQLDRIAENTLNPKLLLYSPAPLSSDWWAATLDLQDYRSQAALARDATLGLNGRPLGTQFVRRYFIGKDLDTRKAAVTDAVRVAAKCTRGLYVSIGVAGSELRSQELCLQIPPRVRYLMAQAFGERLEPSLEREFRRDLPGRGRSGRSGRDYGGLEL